MKETTLFDDKTLFYDATSGSNWAVSDPVNAITLLDAVRGDSRPRANIPATRMVGLYNMLIS